MLVEKCRDLTTFMIFLEFLKMIKLFQRIINSIAQFVKIIIEIFWKHIVAFRYWFFVNDINVDKSRSNYDNKKAFSEMRLYILKHVQWLNAILVNLKKNKLYDFRWKVLILCCWSQDCEFCLRFKWQIFQNSKDNKDIKMIFLSKCFWSSCIY